MCDVTVPTITATRVRNHFLWPAVQRAGAEVKILATNLNRTNPDPEGAPGLDIRFFSFPRMPLWRRASHVLKHSFHEWPRSDELLAEVFRLVHDWRPDIVHAEELRMAYYLPGFHGLPFGGRQTVTYHNVESELLKMTGSSPVRIGKPLIEFFHRRSLKRFEERVVRAADLNLAFSDLDRDRYRALYPKAVWDATRNGVAASAIAPKSQPGDKSVLLFGNLGYAPNVRGLVWFLDHVLPGLSSEIRVTVAGSRASPELKDRLGKSRVRFIDTPMDLDALYRGHGICLVPVFEGSGTRGKILEALAHQRLVVTTSLGVEGLDLTAGKDYVLADTAGDFIAQIERWAANPKGREEISKSGRQAVLEKYDWSRVAGDLLAKWRDL